MNFLTSVKVERWFIMSNQFILKVGGQTFEKFNRFALSLNYNGVASVFSFDGFFDINNPDHKRLFKPLTYPKCQILLDGRVLLTGTILNQSSAIAGESSLTGISGYSLPGVLEDCEIPMDTYPLQSDGLNLREITEKIIEPFGLKLVIDRQIEGDVNSLYPESLESNQLEPSANTGNEETTTEGDEEKTITQTNGKENEKIKDYICKIASQKHIIVTHNCYGNLVFTRVATNLQSIATFTENKPSCKISLSVNGQELHSKINLIGQGQLETDTPTEEEITNPLIKAYRPGVKMQTSGDNSNIPLTAKMARGAELRGIQLTIETNEWYWFDGKKNHIILPNQIIDVISPSNYLSKKTRWFVESVDFTGDNEKTTATIKCVLPEVYTGEEPKYIFQ